MLRLVGCSLTTAGCLAGPDLLADMEKEDSACIVQPVVSVAVAGPLVSAA